ncbi:transcription antitermination factor NusB [Candidatus Roizmanbacteria bacterium RIFCSPHIGHO2_12_FULL_38_13]|nr:MAG: transcription antitermination factor NusB [Candidatus Roizmanbacteria bacterium RIFCSPHIGHO2_12_FULL_38_13]
MDSRHEKRIQIVQNLYALSFQKTKKIVLPHKQLSKITGEIIKNQKKIDDYIHRHAPKYPLDKIAKIDLSILRLAIFELIIEKKEPLKVIINEAVEISKQLGHERSYAFVNAVLGSIVNEISA